MNVEAKAALVRLVRSGRLRASRCPVATSACLLAPLFGLPSSMHARSRTPRRTVFPSARAWKHGLQHRLVKSYGLSSYGLSVTVCHHPSGASKYNPRVFSELSKNWTEGPAAHRLRDHRELHRHHPHQDRPARRCPPRARRVHRRGQDQRQGDEAPFDPPPRHPAQSQLDDQSQVTGCPKVGSCSCVSPNLASPPTLIVVPWTTLRLRSRPGV